MREPIEGKEYLRYISRITLQGGTDLENPLTGGEMAVGDDPVMSPTVAPLDRRGDEIWNRRSEPIGP